MAPRPCFATLVLVLVACAAPGEDPAPADGQGGAPGPACSVDADCDPGLRCEAGACVPTEVLPVCTFEADPVCGADRLCVVNPDSLCAGADACFAVTRCAAPIGDRTGSFACASHDECRSGACYEGSCLQLCERSEDCDGVPCLTVELPRGASTRACVAADDQGLPDFAASRCERDAECPVGRLCARHDGDPFGPDVAPRCVPLDAGLLPQGAACEAYADANPAITSRPESLLADATCASNACDTTCLTGPDVCTLGRCSTPCRTDVDCPDRLVCIELTDEAASPVRPVRYCALPAGGCLSEEDCCPEVLADGRCANGWSTARFHCSPVRLGPRMATACVGEAPRASPGAPCATDGDCASGACVDGAVGKRCGFVCEPARDVCPEMTGEAASVCGSVDVVVGDATFTLPVCR